MAGDRQLNGNVILVVEGVPTLFGPGDTVPAHLESGIGPHLWDAVVEEEKEPVKPPAKAAASKKAVAKPPAPEGADGADGEQGGEDGNGAEGEAVLPKKAGPGSGLSKWVAYAAAHNVTVADGASKDDIIAALAAAGVPTE